MNTNQKSMRYDQNDYDALLHSKIPAALVETPQMNFDDASDASVFFARELDYVKSQSYDVEYPEFTALKLFPVSSEINPGAETVTYYSYDKTGMAKIISSYSTDLPRADVKGKPTTAIIKSLGDSYGYSIQEMRASAMAGKSLDARKAESARYQIDYLNNKIAWNGDAETGVSIMQMDEGLDTGDVLCCEKIAIDPEETSGQLFDRVTAVGARVLCEVVPAIAAGTLKPQPQDHENACLAPMLNKEMAEFRLTESAAHIHNWVRGMNPWPGAWFVTSGGKKLKVMECRAVEAHGEAPGTVLATKPLTVACGEGAVQLLNVVPEGKKPMDGTAFAAGQRLKTGDIL